SAFRSEAAADGVVLDPSRVVAAYHEVEPEVEATRYRPYRDVLSETAMRVAQRLGWSLSPDRETFLAGSLPEWRPFPDANPALVELAGAGCAWESCRTWTTIYWARRGAISRSRSS